MPQRRVTYRLDKKMKNPPAAMRKFWPPNLK